MYTYTMVHSLTGERLLDVTSMCADPSWTTRMHSVGSMRVTLQVRGTLTVDDRPTLRSNTDHWSTALVVSWYGVAVYAGLVGHREWDPRTGQLSLRLVELTHMLGWRMITGVSNYDPNGVLAVSGTNKRGIVRALVQAGLNRGDLSFYWNFQTLDLGPTFTGTESRSWNHHELQAVDSLIQQIRETDGGPDVHLDPEWRAGKLWWVLRLGNTRLTGATFDLSQSAADSPVLNPRLIEDGMDMTTGTFVVGKGTGSDMRVGLGTPGGLDYFTPYRDRKISQKQVADQAELNALGIEDVQAHFYASAIKTFSLQITDDVHPGNLRLGSRLNVWTAGDEFEPKGTFGGYLVGLSGSTKREMGLEVIPA